MPDHGTQDRQSAYRNEGEPPALWSRRGQSVDRAYGRYFFRRCAAHARSDIGRTHLSRTDSESARARHAAGQSYSRHCERRRRVVRPRENRYLGRGTCEPMAARKSYHAICRHLASAEGNPARNFLSQDRHDSQQPARPRAKGKRKRKTQRRRQVRHPAIHHSLLRFADDLQHSFQEQRGPVLDEVTPLRNPNRFGVGKLANAVRAKFATEAGTFHSAERQAWIGGDHCVDEHHSALELRREQFLFRRIICPGAGSETECAVVCGLDCIGAVAHTKNGRDWTENFLAISGRFLRYIGKYGRLVKKS